jgi:inactivated superfamily I helicase
LWRGDDGEAAANFIADWYEKAEVLGEIDVKEYLGLWEAMAAGVMVRPKFGMHPRLRILGPIEARLTHFDTIIAGEVNEGVWPQAAASDPWMSRPMKKDFGFPLPEKAIGVSGLDFSLLMGAEEVFLTRAERVQGTPMVKSRWWMRLETVLKALNLSINDFSDVVYRLSAKNFDKPERFEKVNAPAPCPPVSARPRELSASAIELLMRDPYSVFAKYILRLKPLDDVETDLTMADYGTIIHAILEKFNNKYNEALPPDALEKLLEIGKESFAENNLALERRAFWWPNFEKIAEHLVKVEEEYRQEVRKVHNEVKGKFSFNAPAGVFTVTAKADRVDETKDGRINIIDYKTGKIRTPKEVAKGFAPQLPIEGLIAEKGGFGTLPAAEVAKLIYWQLGRRETVIEENMEDILATTEDHLHKLISVFDFETTPYICHPNPKRIPEYSDYEQLARVKEWSVAEEE